MKSDLPADVRTQIVRGLAEALVAAFRRQHQHDHDADRHQQDHVVHDRERAS